MKLKNSNQLEMFENYFHKKRNDTFNCPEHLRNNNMSMMGYSCIWKYFSMESYCDITLSKTMRKA